MDKLLHECKTILENHYGACLSKLILYGSKARDRMDIDMDNTKKSNRSGVAAM